YLNNQQITGRSPLKTNDKIKICDFLATFEEAPPLPKTLAGDQTIEDEEEDSSEESSTVEAQVSHTSGLILEAQSAEKLKALLEISSKLARTLELDQLLPKIVDRLFEV